MLSMRKGGAILSDVCLGTSRGDYRCMCHIFAVCAKYMSNNWKVKINYLYTVSSRLYQWYSPKVGFDIVLSALCTIDIDHIFLY